MRNARKVMAQGCAVDGQGKKGCVHPCAQQILPVCEALHTLASRDKG